nr:MAG TPA: hypothetical protein [Caudoviricetes sp.]
MFFEAIKYLNYEYNDGVTYCYPKKLISILELYIYIITILQ